MKFRKAVPATEGGPADATAVAPQHAESKKWANGSLLGSKAVTAVVIVAVACGPVALFVARGAATAKPVAHTASKSTQLSVLQQSAGAFAVGYVGAWLGATTKSSAALGAYISTAPATLSEQAFNFRNIAVASVQAGSGDLVMVVVAADVEEQQLSANQPASWPRRYFAVTVSTAGGKLSSIGLPAPVTGPAQSDASPGLGYGQQLSATSKAATTVTLFLSAYLAGQGETEPYVSPSKTILAITPAPYDQVAAGTYLADQELPDQPQDGASASVLATVSLQNQVGQKLTATYSLQLRARAGRWEIFALETAPVLAPHSRSATTPSPSPSGGTTKGN